MSVAAIALPQGSVTDAELLDDDAPPPRGALALTVIVLTKDEERDLPACLASVGGLAEERVPVSTLLPLPAEGLPTSRPRRATQLRLVSVFRRGWIAILAALLNQRRLPLGRFKPESWPSAVQEHTLRGTPEMRLAA